MSAQTDAKSSSALADLRTASSAGTVTVEIATAALRALCAAYGEKLSADDQVCIDMARESPPARGFQILVAVADALPAAPHALREDLHEFLHIVAAAAVAAGGAR